MRTFDVKFKQKVVRAYLSGKGGYKILAAKFDIADSLVRRWGGTYQHHGSAGPGIPVMTPGPDQYTQCEDAFCFSVFRCAEATHPF
jgi:transposase-like protein